MLTQRFKATEMAFQDGDWTRASLRELLPVANHLPTDRDEQEIIAKEMIPPKYLEDGKRRAKNSWISWRKVKNEDDQEKGGKGGQEPNKE